MKRLFGRRKRKNLTPDDSSEHASNITTPPRDPIEVAARAPVGMNPVNAWTRFRDLLIVVIIPLLIPALPLLINRLSDLGVLDSLSLVDIAFGFVAVSIAGTARAATLKSDEWQAVSVMAIVVVCLQTLLATVADDSAEMKNVVKDVATRGAQTDGLQDAAERILEHQPGILLWILCLAVGLTQVVISWVLIGRER
jgi:hypothetical protein